LEPARIRRTARPEDASLSRTTAQEAVMSQSILAHHPSAPSPALHGAGQVLHSESVSEGHPDKVADFIADSILDAHLAQDPDARVAVEVMCKGGRVVLGGEIRSRGVVELEEVVRQALREVGYIDGSGDFRADSVIVDSLLSAQSREIARGVDTGGAGDQGIVFGYATSETPELMPLPILLAHRITRTLAEDRKEEGRWFDGHIDLKPDAKAQVGVRYDADGRPAEVTDVLVSTHHGRGTTVADLEAYVRFDLLPRALGDWHRPDLDLLVNPAGDFHTGGPDVDCGVTGRKIVVDGYGSGARHGGGAFSGKDPTKVDRSGAYFARYAARQVVLAGLAERVEVRAAYAIGRPDALRVEAETYGTGDAEEVRRFLADFDFGVGAIIERLQLRRPIYRRTTNYGHFGRGDAGLSWEA
jgi:S-adenosylmethionine synthetase